MRRAGAALCLGLCLGVAQAGCGGDGNRDEGRAGTPAATATGPEAPPARPRPGEPPEAAQIRGWSRELNAGHFEQAASFFARNAIVEQARRIRLRDRSAAVAFNQSLPCRADVTDVKSEGRAVVAAFRLRPGPGPRSACNSSARVRFRFTGHKFSEWRQLPEAPGPAGDTVQS